ncbi:MAG TPA: GntR family transcriptional regulator [Bryobacteraceae bacterium]
MAVPLLTIDPSSPTPLVRQIVDQLRVLLVEGSLAPGSSLPPVRRVATDLAVHFNTVAQAYRQLAAEGWLDLRHGRGAVVVEREAPSASRREIRGYRQKLRELVSQMRARGVSASQIAAELKTIVEGIQ